MTLQERLRESAEAWVNEVDTRKEAADALDAKDERIRELEGALRPFSCKCGPYRCMAHGDDTDPDDCERHRAREALK